VVILHGTPQDPASFVGTVQGVRLHVVHLPGYGRSQQVVPISDLEAVQRAIEEALEGHGIEEPVLIGCSGGAYRALTLALSGRVRLRALGLFGGFAGLAPAHRDGLGQVAEHLEGGHDLREVLAGASFSASFLAREPERARSYVEGTLRSASPQVIADDLRAVVGSADLGAQLRALSIPVSVVVGEEDASTPRAYADVLASGLGVDVRTIANVGHVLHVEAPDAWQAEIDALLARCGY
jgi:3-oxoadipate enol-lactonase